MSSNITMLKTFIEGELIKAKDTNNNNQYLENKINLIKAEIENKINDISSSLTPFCVNNVTYINGKKQFLTLDVSQDETGEDVKVLHAHAPFTFTTGNRKTINVTSDVYLDVTALQADKTYNIYCDYNDETQAVTLVAMVNKVYKSVVQPDMSVNDIWVNLQEPLGAYIKTLSSLDETNKTLVSTYKDGTISDVNAGVVKDNRRIGDPIPTFSDDLPDNAIWLEGAEVAKVDYPALYAVYGDTYGTPTDENNFCLPDARDRVLWGTTESNFGYDTPKLPNITGGFGANGSGWGSSIANWFGAFYANNLGGSSWFAADSKGACHGATLDASRSSRIYQDVQTVQPPSLKCRVYTYYA